MSARATRKTNTALWSCIIALCFLSCTTTQTRFTPIDGKTYPARSANAEVAIFRDELPSRPFERIARLDVHFEKTVWTETEKTEEVNQLLKEARAAGADAIIEIKEQRSSVGETKILHVTATAIRYTAP